MSRQLSAGLPRHVGTGDADIARALNVPQGHVGLWSVADGRTVWWTGKVAIGLRHQPAAFRHAMAG